MSESHSKHFFSIGNSWHEDSWEIELVIRSRSGIGDAAIIVVSKEIKNSN